MRSQLQSGCWLDRTSTARAGMATVAGAVCLLLTTSTTAFTQDADNPNGRELNGHLFIPSAQIASPFITTNLGNQVGGGMARNVTTVIEGLDEEPIELTADVTFVGLGFQYQQALGSWIAARLNVTGLGRLGTDVEGLLSTGVSATASFNLGAQARIWRNKYFFLSGSLDYESDAITGVNVLNWVKQVVDSGDLTDTLLVESGTTSSFVGGLNMAYSPAAWLGLTGLFKFGIGQGFGDLDARSVYTAALMGDVDFQEFGFIPIGASLFWKKQRFAQRSADFSDSIDAYGGGLFYTGEVPFSIGLEYTYSKVPTDIGPQVNLSQITINLRYFFGQ